MLTHAHLVIRSNNAHHQAYANDQMLKTGVELPYAYSSAETTAATLALANSYLAGGGTYTSANEEQRLCFYLTFPRVAGWESTYMPLFREYNAIQEGFMQGPLPHSNAQRQDDFAQRMSRILGASIVPYMALWSIPVSSEVATNTSVLPTFTPMTFVCPDTIHVLPGDQVFVELGAEGPLGTVNFTIINKTPPVGWLTVFGNGTVGCVHGWGRACFWVVYNSTRLTNWFESKLLIGLCPWKCNMANCASGSWHLPTGLVSCVWHTHTRPP